MTRSAPLGTLQPPNVPLPTLPAQNPGAVSIPPFTDQAPAATPYGTFTAPDPSAVANDPYFQFRAAEGQKAIERSAAARGTLLNGGTLKALEGYRQGLASEEAGKSFDRALGTYTTNRDTNAQNFGQSMGTFRGNLDAFGANTSATLGAFGANTNAALGAGSLNNETALGLYDRESTAAMDTQQAQDAALTSQADAYAQHVAQQRANQAAIDAARPPLPTRLPTPLDRRSGGRG